MIGKLKPDSRFFGLALRITQFTDKVSGIPSFPPSLRDIRTNRTDLAHKLAQIVREHFPPPDPVVVDVVAPDVEDVRDAF